MKVMKTEKGKKKEVSKLTCCKNILTAIQISKYWNHVLSIVVFKGHTS